MKGEYGSMFQNVFSGTLDTKLSEREILHAKLSREAAEEGFVLLKNEGLLPLTAYASIALFGGGAVRTIKGGTGSGDVNSRESVSIYKGLKDADVHITSESWLEDYIMRFENARNEWKEKILEDSKHVENPFDAYAVNPFSLPDGRKILAQDVEHASAAVYVISRISGEGKDRRKVKGDYYLSSKEQEDILYLDYMGIPIVLILNVGSPIELSDLLQKAKQIKAILYISLPGQEGGKAVSNVLFGNVSPGGRLTATWAKHYEDYPSALNYSYLNQNLETEEYREGIYVGYRYFDSFGIQPLFPFGYGLSYTDFSIRYEGISISESGFEITVSVKNTGNIYDGREVVQVYVTPPQSGMPKEYQRLVGFAKTDILPPGGEQKLTISADFKCLSCYSEQQHAWVTEKGSYGVWIGKHSASRQLAALLTAEEQIIEEQTDAICKKTAKFEESCVANSLKDREAEWLKQAKKQNVPQFFIRQSQIQKCQRVAAGEKKTQTEKYTGMQAEDLIPLLYGNITKGAGTLGSAGIRVPGSAGETTEALEENYNIRSLIMADGPAGLRLRQNYEVDRESGSVYGTGVLGALENGFLEEQEKHKNADTYYQYCTAFPVGTALAQSWDTGLMKKIGAAVAVEMEEFHVDLWLAPGMNIQRNPLCGRNFEYYSEDPLLTGIMAAAITEGVQKNGRCGVTVKHFACNNQEDNRMAVDVCICERALREIYLRGFEIAVKKGKPAALMSSYNKINGIHTANSRDLCTTVARKEWGFDGVIMSDWNTTVPKDGSIPWQCAAAGNDIIMPGNESDKEALYSAYQEGLLSEETIRECAGRIIRLIRKLNYYG